jgi:MFS transporter, DHA1 family, inner membrane transport protein
MSPTLCGLPRGQVAAIVAIAAVVPAVLLMAPAIAGQLGAQLGLGPSQVGKVFSSELAGMSLATIPAWWWQKRVDWRWVAVAAALLFITANIASALAVAYAPLLVLRFISALGGGTLMVICMASAAGSTERDRLYGLWVCGQLVMGAIGLWALPRLFTVYGLSALYVGLAILVALCFPLLKQFPSSLIAEKKNGMSESNKPWRATVAILAVLAFYIGLSGVWTFIGTIAQLASIDQEIQGTILAIASLLGIVGALAAAAMGGRLPRIVSLALGYGAMIVSVAALLGVPGLVRFATAAFVFKFIWTYLLPFILASVAELDNDGRLMSTTNLMIGAGVTIGPLVAGQIIERSGGTSLMLAVSMSSLIISLLAITFSRYGEQSTKFDPGRAAT